MANRRRTATVKEQERISNLKKAEFHRRKYAEIRREYELKVKEEVQRKERKARNVEKLERVEADLIRRLQDTQAK